MLRLKGATVRSGGLFVIRFQLKGSLLGCVLREHASACAGANCAPCLRRNFRQVAKYVFAGFGQQNLFAGLEQRIQPVPPIADHRHSAGARLEEPDAGRIPCGDHIGARDVQGKALRAVEIAMLGGIQMDGATLETQIKGVALGAHNGESTFPEQRRMG